MRHWTILVLVAIGGCTGGRPVPASSTDPIEERYPTVAGDVEVTIGSGREIIAPPGSATAGSRWIEHTVTYTNKSQRPVWVAGYSERFPFSGIETRNNEDAAWRDYGRRYCATGAREIEIAPNTSHNFTAALPQKYVGEEFRVMLPYRTALRSQRWVQAVSEPAKLGQVGPGAG